MTAEKQQARDTQHRVAASQLDTGRATIAFAQRWAALTDQLRQDERERLKEHEQRISWYKERR